MGTRNENFLALATAVLVACALTGVAAAGEAERQEAMRRLPQVPPAAAFPDVAQIDMIERCTELAQRSGTQRFYPRRAARQGIAGNVVIDCALGVDNKWTTCQILHEEPLNYGFGDAAASIFCYFRVDPTTLVNETPLIGNEIPPDTWSYRRSAEGEPWRIRRNMRFQLSD